MSRRTERVASQIRRIVAEAIQHHLNDPRIEPLTSITRVDVAEDFALARIRVSILAEPNAQRRCLQALQAAASRLRSLVAEGLSMRTIPRLVFQLDDSLKQGFQTVQTIDQLMAELGEPRPWDVADDDEDDEAGEADEVADEPAADASSGDATSELPGKRSDRNRRSSEP